MPKETQVQCEKPEKSWKEYGSEELRRYYFRNKINADCSFIMKDMKDNKSNNDKVFESFQWILCELSPILKKMLNDEENLANNCQSIPISDDEYFESVLLYCHAKEIDESVDLIRLYETLIVKYEIDVPENEIFSEKGISWIKLFQKAYIDYKTDERWQSLFEKVLCNLNNSRMERDLVSDVDLILNFDAKSFDKLFDIMIERSLYATDCLLVTEQYLTKHLLNGDATSKPGAIERTLIDLYMNRIEFDKIWFINFLDSIVPSKLLSLIRKIGFLQKKSQNAYDCLTNVVESILNGKYSLRRRSLFFRNSDGWSPPERNSQKYNSRSLYGSSSYPKGRVWQSDSLDFERRSPSKTYRFFKN